jgi:hypothetical protein
MANETLWTGFNGRKLFAERAKNDEKGRSLASAIDRQYVSDATVDSNTDTLTITVSNDGNSAGTTRSVTFTGQQNTIEHIFVGPVAGGNELVPDADKNVELPVAGESSGTAYGGLLSDSLSEKLHGIEDGAQENIIEEVQVNGSALTPDTNKAVNVVIPVTGVQRNGTDITPDANHKVNVEVPVLGVQIEGDANPLTPDSTTKIVEIPLATASGTGVTGNSGVISAGDLADLEYLATAKPTGASANNPLITQTDLQTAIADFGGFREVPGDPTTGEPVLPSGETPSTKIVYLVEDSSATGDDKFKEWIYDSTNSSWKLIGDTTMSMSGYAKIPSSKTAGNIVEFTSTDTLADSGKTVADLENVIESISIGAGSAISPVSGSKNVVIPLAANNSGTGTDGAMAGADKVKLDGIETGAQVNTVATVSVNGGTPVSPDGNKNIDLTVSIPAASSATPQMDDATASAGSSTDYARADHVHPSDTTKADKVTSATDGNLAGLDANGNLTDSGVAPDDFVTGIKLEGAQSALNPDSNGVVTIPNAVATGQAGATNGLMTDAQALELSQIAAWTWSYAPFTDSGEGSESTAAFPFTVS